MASPLSEFAVYTILHPDQLEQLASAGHPARLRATKRWVTGKLLFDEARATGETMPIVYADAARDCSRLIYRGELSALDVDTSGTSYTVANLTPLRGHRTQELELRSTGEKIAEGYLRPYAIVRTPVFLPRPTPSQPVTLFTFGYWGNGSATGPLVEAIDAAERQRGFEPPLWVDIRIQRSVRAVGFRDDAFARLLGPRYVWMPALGNLRVQQGESGIQIKKPAAARELLDHANARPARRVIFFCACEHPEGCHRHEVARLVVRAARARDAEVTVVEWPGEEPREMVVDMLPATFRKIVRGTQRTLPVPVSMNIGEAASVPWGSRLVMRSAGEEQAVLVGPARFDAHGAHLAILKTDGAGTQAAGRRFRSAYGYGPMS